MLIGYTITSKTSKIKADIFCKVNTVENYLKSKGLNFNDFDIFINGRFLHV